MAIKEVNKDNFAAAVLEAKGPVLVDFYADWCGPCQMLHPILEEVAADQPAAQIVMVNIDENSDLAAEYGVSSIPCLVKFVDGAESERSVGLVPREQVETLLEA